MKFSTTALAFLAPAVALATPLPCEPQSQPHPHPHPTSSSPTSILPIVLETNVAIHGEKFSGITVDVVDVSSTRHAYDIKWPRGVEGHKFLDWRTFKANGANLGAWFAIEKTFLPVWWNDTAPDAVDEWTMCEYLGKSKCAQVLEEHWKTFITTADIDHLATVGVNLIRITTSYAAWVDVPGSWLVHGNQQHYLRKVALYAIEKYNMHVVIDLHSLPGGVNYLDIGEAVGHDNWFNNNTNLEYSWQAIESILDFIRETGHINAFSIAPINEPCNNISGIFTSDGLTDDGVNWINTYMKGTLKLIGRVDSRIPLLFQDGFLGEEYWSPFYDASENIVFDRHVYYFLVPNATSALVPQAVCKLAPELSGDHKFPVFIGEWAIQSTSNNTLADRKTLFDTQRFAWQNSTSGSAFWTAKSASNATVKGEGNLDDYWEYELLIDEDVITYEITESYC